MRKDITIEKIMLGGERLNKSALARQYGCCWETIDRRLNPDKYKKEKKVRIYKSILDPYKNIIDEKIENNNIPATGVYFLLKNKYGYKGKYGIVRNYISSKKKSIITNLTIRFETIKGYQSQVDWKEKLKLHDINGNEYESDIINKSNAKTLEIYDNKITNLIGRRNSDNTAVIKIKNASNFNISNIILYYDELDKNNKVISDAKTNIDMTLSADEVVQVQFTPKGFTDTIEITGYNYIVEDCSVNVDLKNNEIEIYENDKYLENSKNYEVMSINKINNKKYDKEDLTFVMKIKNTSQKNLGNIVLKIAEIDKNKEVVKIDHIIYNSILKPNDEAEIATSLYNSNYDVKILGYTYDDMENKSNIDIDLITHKVNIIDNKQ